MTARKRRTDWGPTWVAWWLLWFIILFGPLALNPIVGGIWIACWATFGGALIRQKLTRRPHRKASRT
jgi:hypothetical protein